MELTDNKFERTYGRNYEARKAQQSEENNERAQVHRSYTGGAGSCSIVV
jgi:hypothetical protein